MNFLQLSQRLARETGVAGAGPSTVIGQTGEAGRLVNWVADAWNDIQTTHQDWEWLRASVSFVTMAGQARYTPTQCGITAGTFGMWARNTFRNYDTAAGVSSEIEMDFTHYEDWRQSYDLGALKLARTRPIEVTVTPAKEIALGPYPAAGYTITGDYYTAPVILSLDADTPAMPAQFHMAIVWKAMMSYGAFESASEVYARGELEFGKFMMRMTADRLPEITMAGALA